MSGLIYERQISGFIIGDDSTDATLTASYSNNSKVLGVGGFTQIVLYVQFTPAQNTRKLVMKLEFSPDNDNVVKDFYQTSQISNVSGIRSLAQEEIEFTGAIASTTYSFRFSEPIADKNLRLSVKEDAMSDFGTVNIRYTLSG